MAENPNEVPVFLKAFSEHREKLIRRLDEKVELGFKVASELDRTLVSLSGGALVFSMTFVDKLAPAKLLLPVLFGAWAAFAASMGAVIFAMRGAQNHISQEIAKFTTHFSELDQAEKAARTQPQIPRQTVRVIPSVSKSTSVGWLNVGALVAFVIGVTLLGIFVGFNLWNTPPSPNSLGR